MYVPEWKKQLITSIGILYIGAKNHTEPIYLLGGPALLLPNVDKRNNDDKKKVQ